MDRILRIFDVLELLARYSHGLTVTEISKQLDLPISSTHNLLHRLVSIDAVVAKDDLRYSLGARAIRYGIAMMEGLELRGVARSTLQELAHRVRHDVYLAERFGDRVRYTDKVLGPRPVNIDIRLGQSLYLHATAVGKLFAAHHPDLREGMLNGDRPQLTAATIVEPRALEMELDSILVAGYAVSDGEAYPGIMGIAIPVRDARNVMVGAIHISVLKNSGAEPLRSTLLSDTIVAARAIERSMGRDVEALEYSTEVASGGVG